jgi:hypothetical protein
MEPTSPRRAGRHAIVLALEAVQTALHGLPSNELQQTIPNPRGIETNSLIRPNRFFQFLRL